MKKIGKILCLIDPTSSQQPAMNKAAWLANEIGAEIELFACLYGENDVGDKQIDSIGLKDVRKEISEPIRQRLEEYALALRQRNLRVTVSLDWDRPLYAGIVRHAQACDADVVFKDTHHHTALNRALMTNTDWNLIRHCPIPLWLVRSTGVPQPGVIVASIDPMHHHDKPAALDDRILLMGKSLANSIGAELHAFHSYNPADALADANANAYLPVSLPYDEIKKDMRAKHGARFSEIVDFHKIPINRQHLMSGLASEELPILAEKLGADLVIMGAVARSRWQHLFIGATAERILEDLPCDLLIIKPDLFRTSVDNHQIK